MSSPRPSALHAMRVNSRLLGPGGVLDTQTSDTQFFGGHGILGLETHPSDSDSDFGSVQFDSGSCGAQAQYSEEDSIQDDFGDVSSPTSSVVELAPHPSFHVTPLGEAPRRFGTPVPVLPSFHPHTPVKLRPSPAITPTKSRSSPAPVLSVPHSPFAHPPTSSSSNTPTPTLRDDPLWQALDKLLKGPTYADGESAEVLPLLRRVNGIKQNLHSVQAFNDTQGSRLQQAAVLSFTSEYRRISFEDVGLSSEALGNATQMEILVVLRKLTAAIPVMATATMRMDTEEQKKLVRMMEAWVEGLKTLVKIDIQARKDLTRGKFTAR
ncbi:hypothetical protein BXZ70DRAFT_1064953 [Cristinia sonorae]|uniref:Uncharacterized protein n=1 Tax=Cristinia sonorae TaxID=1940300 RepID=A0A8K0UMZ2_9AGAR|nr:hypothetical protein BXZ70DRAFT_1064953 [Cristinia sonorae]